MRFSVRALIFHLEDVLVLTARSTRRDRGPFTNWLEGREGEAAPGAVETLASLRDSEWAVVTDQDSPLEARRLLDTAGLPLPGHVRPLGRSGPEQRDAVLATVADLGHPRDEAGFFSASTETLAAMGYGGGLWAIAVQTTGASGGAGWILDLRPPMLHIRREGDALVITLNT